MRGQSEVKYDKFDIEGLDDLKRELIELARWIEDEKVLKSIFRKGAKPFVEKAKANAPEADDDVLRYDTPKSFGLKKAPKGYGNVVAVYSPGNLKRSIREIAARRLVRAIIIGPKRAKRNPYGKFSGNRVDAFYAHFLELGTKTIGRDPFMKPAWESTKNEVIRNILDLMIAEIRKKTQTA